MGLNSRTTGQSGEREIAALVAELTGFHSEKSPATESCEPYVSPSEIANRKKNMKASQ